MSVWNFEVVEYTTDYTAVVVPLEIVPPASTFIDEMNEIDQENNAQSYPVLSYGNSWYRRSS